MGKYDVWPKYQGLFGRWSMIAPGTAPDKLKDAEKLATFNAKSETTSKLWTFRLAWQHGRRRIIPADAIFEPDWRPVYEGLAQNPAPIGPIWYRTGLPLVESFGRVWRRQTCRYGWQPTFG